MTMDTPAHTTSPPEAHAAAEIPAALTSTILVGPATLIVDKRERNVTRHSAELDKITWESQQITTADYVITRQTAGGQTAIVAIIERKSLEDFAASIKDGRHANKEKLVAMRAKTGCAVIFIVEGPHDPSPTDNFGNIPYRHIESSIFHLAVRDKFSIFRTRDTLDTARWLVKFVTSIGTIEEIGGGVEPPATPVPADMSMLTARHETSDTDIIRAIWAKLPGISVTSADDYARRWSLKELAAGIPADQISSHKLATGRAINKKVAASLSGCGRALEVKLLSGVPGVSMTLASQILQEHGLAAVLSWGVGGIALINRGKKKVGDKLAARIVELFDKKL